MKMKQLFLIVGFLSFTQLFGQSDSLRVYSLISDSKSTEDKELSLSLAEEAKGLSEDLGLSVQIAASSNLFKNQLRFHENYSGLKSFFELNNLLEKNERWSTIIENYQFMGDYYQNQKLFTNAIQYVEKAEDMAIEHELPWDHWKSQIQKGDLNEKSQKLEEALGLYQNALLFLDQADSANNERRIITYRRIATCCYQLQDYNCANDANLSALEIIEKQDDKENHTAQLNNIGFTYKKLGQNKKALEYFVLTLYAREKLGYTDKDHIGLLVNIGVAYQNLDKPSEGREYLNRAEKAAGSLSDRASINDLIAFTYLAEDELVLAKSYNSTSLIQAKNAKNKNLESKFYLTKSKINEKALAYDEALTSFKRHLALKDSLDDALQKDQQQLLQTEYALERTQGEILGLINSNQIKDLQIQELTLKADNKEKTIQIQQTEARAKLQALQLERKTLEADKKERELAILKAREENQKLLFEQQKLEEEKAQQELAIAAEKNRVQQLQLDQRKAANFSLIIILILAFVAACIMLIAWLNTRKKNKQLADSKELIRQERDRSDNLLLNILPESTANELKEKGRAAPKKFESATIFFSDFKEFSSLSKSYKAEELLEELELFFDGFDRIIAKYGIEKIKTIGDAYMCASGIPIECEDHAIRMVKAAVEMIEFTEAVHKRQIESGKKPWYLRIGINTGPVVAGVIGSNKFIYDVWGDSVNLASRLETAGEPGRINISQHTLDQVKGEVRTSFRGEIEVKNMGSVRMFFVEGLRSAPAQQLK